MSEKAQFFWHGRELTLYEHCCLLSFLKNGFEVDLYSYQPLTVPEGVHLRDAGEVLTPDYLTRYTQAGQKANMAAFSDVFRYALLKKQGGWWFDIDVFCLKPADEFTARFDESLPLVIGSGLGNWLESANLKINDDIFFDEIDRRVEEAGTVFEWGTIGPKLLTKAVEHLKMGSYVVSSNLFYPVQSKDVLSFLIPSSRDLLAGQCSDSFTVHFFREFFSRWKIPLNIAPPDGSYLLELFLEVNPEVSSLPRLPEETAIALTRAAAQYEEWERLKKQEERFKNNVLYQTLKRLKNRLTGNV